MSYEFSPLALKKFKVNLIARFPSKSCGGGGGGGGGKRFVFFVVYHSTGADARVVYHNL